MLFGEGCFATYEKCTYMCTYVIVRVCVAQVLLVVRVCVVCSTGTGMNVCIQVL